MYQSPFTVNKTTTLKMRSFIGTRASLTNTAFIEKVELKAPVEPSSVVPGLTYRYYIGFFRRIHDYSSLAPVMTGTVPNVMIEERDREQYFAFTFEGLIKIPTDGFYIFYLKSNDGAQMLLDNRVLIDSDGLHPTAEKQQRIALKAGLHPITVHYFQEGGTHHLQVGWQGPGFEKQDVPASVVFH
jgi:hypothetical protein